MPKSDTLKKRFHPDTVRWRAAMAAAAVSGAFCLVVSSLLIVNYLQVSAATPLENPELLALRAKLGELPAEDPALVAQIRAMDLLARRAFFTSQEMLRTGGLLLLAGAVALAIALRLAARWKPQLPAPDPEAGEDGYWLVRARTRELLMFFGAVWLVVALGAAVFTPLDFPAAALGGQGHGQTRTGTDGPVSAAVGEGRDTVPAGGEGQEADPAAAAAPSPVTVPGWDEVRRQWPNFRGPGGIGVAFHTNAPVTWNAETGENIRWKTEVPLPGFNSPVVWGNRVFLSGSDAETREVYCFDADSGELLWRHPVADLPGFTGKIPEFQEETGFAAPTMAAQGDRVFAIFATGDLVCLDHGGKMLWGKNLGVPDNHYAHSSSLIVYEDLLLVQYDQKKDGKIIALHIGDGREVWTVPRERISWASPVCVETPLGWQLVVNSIKDVDAYNPRTGQALWKLKCLDGEVAPSPAYGAGIFFVANEYATATAIRVGGTAESPEPEALWEFDEILPDVSSPLVTEKHAYLTTFRGEIACLDPATGEVRWVQELDEGFRASPILVGDRIYLMDAAGKMLIFKDASEFELVGEPALGEEAAATPAFLDGRIYIRTLGHLVCIAGQ